MKPYFTGGQAFRYGRSVRTFDFFSSGKNVSPKTQVNLKEIWCVLENKFWTNYSQVIFTNFQLKFLWLGQTCLIFHDFSRQKKKKIPQKGKSGSVGPIKNWISFFHGLTNKSIQCNMLCYKYVVLKFRLSLLDKFPRWGGQYLSSTSACQNKFMYSAGLAKYLIMIRKLR